MLLRRLKYRLFLKSKFEFVVISHNPPGTKTALLNLLGIQDVLISDDFFLLNINARIFFHVCLFQQNELRKFLLMVGIVRAEQTSCEVKEPM